MMKSYTVSDYRSAVCELNSYDIGSPAFELAKLKVDSIMVRMLENEDTRHWMAMDIEDGLSQLNDCAVPFSDKDVQHLLWLLDEAGYEDDADEIRGWDWLEDEKEEEA